MTTARDHVDALDTAFKSDKKVLPRFFRCLMDHAICDSNPGRFKVWKDVITSLGVQFPRLPDDGKIHNTMTYEQVHALALYIYEKNGACASLSSRTTTIMISSVADIVNEYAPSNEYLFDQNERSNNHLWNICLPRICPYVYDHCELLAFLQHHDYNGILLILSVFIQDTFHSNGSGKRSVLEDHDVVFTAMYHHARSALSDM